MRDSGPMTTASGWRNPFILRPNVLNPSLKAARHHLGQHLIEAGWNHTWEVRGFGEVAGHAAVHKVLEALGGGGLGLACFTPTRLLHSLLEQQPTQGAFEAERLPIFRPHLDHHT